MILPQEFIECKVVLKSTAPGRPGSKNLWFCRQLSRQSGLEETAQIYRNRFVNSAGRVIVQRRRAAFVEKGTWREAFVMSVLVKVSRTAFVLRRRHALPSPAPSIFLFWRIGLLMSRLALPNKSQSSPRGRRHGGTQIKSTSQEGIHP
jgi:hypothetical protein